MSIPLENKVYLLIRALVKYGKIFNDLKKMKVFSDLILNQLSREDSFYYSENIFKIIHKIFEDKIFYSPKKGTLVEAQYKKLRDYLSDIIDDKTSLKLLYVAVSIIGPETKKILNKLNEIKPHESAKKIAEKELEINHDNAIEKLILNWDEYSYNEEFTLRNSLSVELSKNIKKQLSDNRLLIKENLDDYCIASALTEFERRAGNSGKTKSGKGLEMAVKVILEHIGINVDPVPQEVSGILEADHVLYKGGKAHGKMLIVSCKRTGRERVKQVSVEKDELTRMKIARIIWFMTEFDQSAERVVQLGVRGSIFYLPDSSKAYKDFSMREDTKKYVRPLSTIRDTILTFFESY